MGGTVYQALHWVVEQKVGELRSLDRLPGPRWYWAGVISYFLIYCGWTEAGTTEDMQARLHAKPVPWRNDCDMVSRMF